MNHEKFLYSNYIDKRTPLPHADPPQTEVPQMDTGIEQGRAAARANPQTQLIPGVGRPQALFMLAAGLSFLMSVYLFFNGSPQQGIFVGIWVPSILSAGALLLGRGRS